MSSQAKGDLSQFQVEAARVFFSLPESAGFLLAGGGALIAQGIVARETEDLDFFAHRGGGDVGAAAKSLEAASLARGWGIEVIRRAPDFCRIKLARSTGPHGEEETLYVDLAIDTPPVGAPTVTIVGPALSAYELAVRKTLALFNRAEARDFVDVRALHQHVDRRELLMAAATADRGFDVRVFAEMLRSHRRFRDEDYPSTSLDISALRAYFEAWADEIEA